MKKILCFAILLCSALFGEEYTAKNFSYLVEKMPKMDRKLMEIHLKLYDGYVNQVNFLNSLLKKMERERVLRGENKFIYDSIKRRYGFEYDGMVLHELYFENLGGNGKISKRKKLYRLLEENFGSVNDWEKEIYRLSQMRGIGWIILYYDPETSTLLNGYVSDHDEGLLANMTPLFVIDLWEHAYISQFGLDKSSYIGLILSYADWGVVEKRLSLAAKMSPKKPKGSSKKIGSKTAQENTVESERAQGTD